MPQTQPFVVFTVFSIEARREWRLFDSDDNWNMLKNVLTRLVFIYH